MEIELAPYCSYAKNPDHARENCLQCELLERFFYRLWEMTQDVLHLYRADTLKRSEREVSDDIARVIRGFKLK